MPVTTVLISVVMSVYNGENYIREAIDSVLNQTFPNFEFIIVDDGSTDSTLEVINSYNDNRIKILTQSNQGQAVARNNAIKKSRGKYIAILDADDISLSRRLELQYDFLRKHPECLATGANAQIIDKEGNYVFETNILLSWLDVKKSLPKMPFYHSSIMFRKEAFLRVGGYPEIFRIEDVVFVNKIANIGQIINLPNTLIKYRLVPQSTTNKGYKKDSKFTQKAILYAIENNLDEYQIENLKTITIIKSEKWKNANYYQHIAKKYLWNNYKPILSRKNVLKSIKIKPFFIQSYIIFILSFFPEKVLNCFHDLIS